MKSERQHREEIVRFGRMLHERGYIAATDGNLSVRLEPDAILCTPTGMSKGMLEPDDLVVVDRSGHLLSGYRNVSSEIGMHLLIYRLRPDCGGVVHAHPPTGMSKGMLEPDDLVVVDRSGHLLSGYRNVSSEIGMHLLIYRMRSDCGGIVHAHPPTATGYAAAGLPLNQALVSEIVLSLGRVPLAPYATPGTPELCDTLTPLVPQHDAILMANHGVVSYGQDLLRAYMNMETVEHFARIALVTHMLGRQQLLNENEIAKLAEARVRYLAACDPRQKAADLPAAPVGNPERR